MSSRRSLAFALACALIIWLTPACYGQAVAVAQVQGQVLDTSGAAVPGAQVKMTQTATQYVRQTQAGADGSYSLSNLPVGPYVLEAAAEGFKTYIQSGIVLQVDNNIQVNVTLQVGAITENVQVTASASMVETKNNSVAQVIDERRITDLPLNGRQATDLIVISGAATPTPNANMISSKNYPSSTTMSVAGGQGNGTNYLLDGGDNTSNFTNVNMPFPFPDALQEFSVETSSLPARNGLHPGGVVNVVTKSGANQLHGDLFEFLRNGDVNARNFFGIAHDSLKRNQFGGTLGHRIIKDKLFFFGGFQLTRNRQNRFRCEIAGRCLVPWRDMPITPTSPFKGRHFRGEVIIQCVRWYLQYPLAYQHVSELLAERGVQVDPSCIWRWVQAYAPELNKRCRPHLKPTNTSYRTDETYIKVKGEDRYLYRAVDSTGHGGSCSPPSAMPQLPNASSVRL